MTALWLYATLTLFSKDDPQLCALLVTGSWVIANLNVLLHTLLMARLSFCADNAIPHFFCDVTPSSSSPALAHTPQ